MFSDKKTKNTTAVQERNILGKTSKIIGDIISEGDFRIDGDLEGNLRIQGKIIIGKDGRVKGNVECNNADIEGFFAGKLFVKNLLNLKATANISGEVIIGKLAVEPDAIFNATCDMKGDIKELVASNVKKTAQTA